MTAVLKEELKHWLKRLDVNKRQYRRLFEKVKIFRIFISPRLKTPL